VPYSPYKLALELGSLQQIFVAEKIQPMNQRLCIVIFVRTVGNALFRNGSLLSPGCILLNNFVFSFLFPPLTELLFETVEG
jgi:hypothetical protein